MAYTKTLLITFFQLSKGGATMVAFLNKISPRAGIDLDKYNTE